MASELKVDKFTGVTTAGSIDVTGEGNSTTTNLQQGLCKVWCSFDQDSSGHPLFDSINVASTADGGTGITVITFTNNMGNDDYADLLNGTGQNEGGMSGGNYSVSNHSGGGQKQTSQVGTDVRDSAGNNRDIMDVRVTIHGDLA